MKVLYPLSFALLLSLHSFAQDISNYTFSTATNGSLVADANSNTINMNTGFVQLISENSTAGAASAVLNMNLDVNPIDPASAPFEFWYMGAKRTVFNVNSNGLIRLDATTTTSTFAPASGAPILAAFAQTTTSGTSMTGTVRAKLVGSAPYRTLVVEWKNLRIPYTSVTADGTFQVRLYESTGVIEYVYGAMRAGGGITPVTYNIGIASSNTATTAGYVTVASNTFTAAASPVANPAPTAATTIDNLHSTSDGSRRVYSWSPSVTPNAPSGLNFTAVTQTSMTVNWTDNASNETGYAVYMSTDGGSSYFLHTLTGANSTSLAITSNYMMPGYAYYFKVYAVNEGGISGEISGNQTTNAAGTKTAVATGNWNAAATWSPSGAPTRYDDVTIPSGVTVTINVTNLICNNLTVNGTVSLGTVNNLRFDVHNNLTVNTGGVFQKTNANTGQIMYIGSTLANAFIGGNLIVNGTFDVAPNATQNNSVTLNFCGNISSEISGSGTLDFGYIYLYKGAQPNSSPYQTIMELKTDYTYLQANTYGPFVNIPNGTLKVTGATKPLFYNNAPSIAAAGGLWLNNSSYSVAASSTCQTSYTNTGFLRVTAGTLNIGSAANNNLVLGAGSTTLIEGGTVTAAGCLGVTTAANTVTYKQTAGTVTASDKGYSPAAALSCFDIGTSTSSYFEMSGGTVTINVANTASTTANRIDVRGGAGSVNFTTGGKISVGASALYYLTGAVPNFDANGKNITLFSSTQVSSIWGDYTNPSTLTTSSNTIYFRGAVPGSGTITGTNGKLAFWGTSAQTLGGTLTTPLEIWVNNPAGVTIPSTTMSATNASLWLLNGTLNNSGTLTFGGGGTTIQKVVRDNGSIGSGTFTLNRGSGAHTIDYRYLGASTGAVTTASEYFFDGTATNTVLSINNFNGITLGTASAAGTLNLHCGLLNTTTTNLMSVLNNAVAGVTGGGIYSYVNGPLNRAMPNVASGTYTFPVGTATTYARYDLPISTSTGATLSAQVEYIESATGGTAGAGFASLLNRYWKVDKTVGTGNLTNFLPVVYTSGLTNATRLGYSATLTGAYANYSAAPVSGTLTSIKPITITGTAPQSAYFVLGNAGTLSGTIPAGASTSYPDLASVAHALRTMQVTGNVVFEFTGYTGENIPNQTVSFYPFTTDGPSYTATIRPASGESAFVTSGDPGSTLSLIEFNGIDSLTIDGRPGGTGTAIEWIFRNTRTAATVGPTFRLVNDATYNKLDYLNIQGQNITATSGTITFESTAGTLGNSYNTISNCHIRDRSDVTGTPVNGIFSQGAAPATSNSYNNILNNHIYNNFYAGTAGYSIYVYLNNIGWTISGNHIYQTTARAVTAGYRYGIYINNTNAGSAGFKITDNFIGGSQANAGGAAMTYNGNVNQSYGGIYLNVNATGSNIITRNTIKNISLSHGSTAVGSLFTGIYNAAGGNDSIAYNKIGGPNAGDTIRINSNLGTLSTTYGIYTGAGTDTIINNRISNIKFSTATGGVGFYGIYTGNSSVNLIIENDTVSNINSLYTGASAASLRGIYTAGSGLRIIRNNRIHDMSSLATYTGSSTTSLVLGIAQAIASQGHIISGNTIHSLSCATTGNIATNIVGLYSEGTTSGTANIISGNAIHNLSMLSSSNSATTTITGIMVNSGIVNVSNNMVQMGIDTSGGSVTGNYLIRGILHVPTTANSAYYYNTIYVGGSGVGAGINNSYAFNRTAASGNIYIKNNIFYNARSNGAGTGKHFAIGIANMTGIVAANCDYNFYHALGTGGAVGQDVSNVRTTLADWQGILANLDKYSLTGSLTFVKATGNAAAADLHINNGVGTQIESAGTVVAGFDTDYDNEYRFGNGSYSGVGTAPDMGADEEDFTLIDLTAPNIVYTVIPTQLSMTAPSLIATITDASGVDIAAGVKPRLYYKRSTDANAYNDNTNSTNGWKWVEYSSKSGDDYTFTIDYSRLNGGAANERDSIQYFVVAQDAGPNVPVTPNVGIKYGTFSSTPDDVALVTAEMPNVSGVKSYLINVLSGTVTVGSSGADYPSLTNDGGLFQAINTGVLSGNLIASITTNLTAETGTHALNQWTETGGSGYTLTIQPDAAATRTVSGALAGALFRLDGADRVTIDGHYSGAGKYLVFANTTAGTSSATWQFINEASYNTIKNCDLQGSSTSTVLGVVVFGISAAGTLGNSYNVIDSCLIHQYSTGLPLNGIYSAGASGKINTNNTISNNNIYDWFVAASSGSGILLANYNAAWTITGNNLYQTASRAGTGAVARYGIQINNAQAGSDGYIIRKNYIGGSAPNAGGTAMTFTGTPNQSFVGIYLNPVSTATACVIDSNVVTNIVWNRSTAANASAFAGIYKANGYAKISNNRIGGLSGGNYQITVTDAVAGTASTSYGICSAAGNDTIINNTVGAILLSSTAGQIGINGIYAGTGTNIVSANTIAMVSSAYTGSAAGAYVRGIVTSTSGIKTISDNTIYQLATASANTTTGATTVTIGILQQSTTAGHTISGNIIHSLTNSATSAATNIVGLYYDGAASGTNTISKNFVHSLSMATSSNSAATTITGIQINTGLVNVVNNVVRLGIDSAGNAVTGNYLIRGILHTPTTANSAYYYNTVYIGGSGVGTGSNKTYAFNRTAASGNIYIKNNIYYNARSNGAGTGNHFAVGMANMTGIVAANVNYNFLYAGGTGGAIGEEATTARTTLTDWQGAANTPDVNSLTGTLTFEDATGNAAAADLHLNKTVPTQVESNGIAISGFDTDYDGEYRQNHGSYSGSGSAPDIGADEYNFPALDLAPPVISYTAIGNQCNTVSSVSLSATITDGSSVQVGTGNRPRVYYRKLSGNANTYAGNTSSDNGWKWVEAGNTTSPFNFTLNLSLLYGGYIAGDAIQYFVVAQDSGVSVPNANVGASVVTFNSTPASVALTAAAFPASGSINAFGILPCQGTVEIGTGEKYLSFTKSGSLNNETAGLFQAINAATLTGDLLIKVTSDISIEDGAVALNQNAGAYNIRIEADGSTLRSISNSANPSGGLFRMDGADNVRFNGGSGTNRYLKFTNTHTGSAVFQFLNDATSDTLNNLLIEGSTSAVGSGVVFITTTTGSTGNDNIHIENCDIKEAGSNLPTNGIYSYGTSGKTNDNIVVKGCTISNNFLATANANYAGIYVSSYNSGWTIENNKLFQTATRTSTGSAQPFAGIFIGNATGAGGGFTVKDNVIGYANASGTGTTTYSGTGTNNYVGIYMNVLASPVSTVSGNTISNISYSSGSGAADNQGMFSGIFVYTGAVNISGNTIGATTGTGAITLTGPTAYTTYVYGIRNWGAGPVKITGNNIGSISASASGTNAGVQVVGISSYTGDVSVRNNLIGSLTTPNSIQTTGTVTTNTNMVAGIHIKSPSVLYTDTIKGNTIVNLNNLNTGTSTTIKGILAENQTTAGSFRIDSNYVAKINCAGTGTGANSSSTVMGISYFATGAPMTITKNKVLSLVNAASTSGNYSTIGIYTAAVTTGTNTVSKNFVHSFKTSNAAVPGSAHIGIYVNGGTATYSNNLVRLGIDPSGTGITTGLQIIGIYETGTTVNHYYFNSVYIGGSNVTVASGAETFAMNAGSTSTTARNIKNNIFWNARSNASTGGSSHYSLRVNNTTNMSCNYNDLLADGNDGKVGVMNSTPYTSFAAWKSGTSLDGASTNYDPKFIAPTGDTTGINLHINTLVGTPVESAGTPIAGLTIDHEDDLRFGDVGYTGTGTAPDIGADEGEFIFLDITPPAISFTDLGVMCNTATSQTLSATITDAGSGVDVGTGLKPRVYYKKTSDANTYAGNTSGDNGWKWAESSSSASPFSFTLDFTKLYGGTVVAGDAIQYFVAAQDSSANVGITSGVFDATPASINLTAAAFPLTGTIKSFAILPCEGTVTVGASGNYLGFTPNGALFEAINATSALGGLTGNLTVNVISDVAVENGVNALNQWTGAYTVTIQPGSASVKTISNAANIGSGAMIPINGADGLTISGKYSGSGKYLRFLNTHTTASSAVPTIHYYNTSTGNLLENCYIEGNTTGASTAVLLFGTGSNGTITVSGNEFTSPSAGTINNPANFIYSNNTNNTPITISGNNFSNFTTRGINLTSGGPWTIGGTTAADGNNFFQSNAASTAQTAIYSGVGSHTIRYNRIGGNAAPVSNVIQGIWSNSGNVTVTGIEVGSVATGTVADNTIQSFDMTGTGASGFNGITISSSGTVTTQSNTIGGASKGISGAGTAAIRGIYSTSSNASSLIGGNSGSLGNTINSLSASSTSAQVIGIHTSAGSNTIQNNTISALTHSGANTGTNASASVIGILLGNTSGTQNTLNNTIYGLGNSASAAVSTIGICLGGAATHVVAGNNIRNFDNTANTSILQGINIVSNSASSVVRNNMIALGYNASGTSNNNNATIAGITKAGANALSIYHNSVYIGGSAVSSSTLNTYAFQRTANANDDIRNNIFANARTNGSGSALHYAYVLNGTTISQSNYNLYYSSSGNMASVNGGTTSLATVQALKFSLTGKDLNSGSGDPVFNAPTSGTANLHLTSPSPAEGAGFDVGVTDDYDGDTRASLSPVDMGADAANLTAVDVYAPIVSVNAITNQAACSGNITIPVTATVNDVGSSGIASGANAPKLWWRLSSGTWASISPTTVSAPTYTYDLNISGVTSGQTYEYYVAAQDQASTPNLGYSHFNATTPVHTSVNSQTTAPASPGTFSIISATPLSGVKTVGTSGDYATLTGAGGLFADINSKGLDGDLIVTIISNTSETGANALNQWNEYCGGPYSLLIQPDGTTQRTLSASFAGDLFNINGADRVTIDGSFSGSGQYLKFVNSNSANNTFILQNGTTDFNLLNCVVEGQANQTSGTAKAVVNIGGTASNNNIRIAGNKLGSSSYSANVIYAAGAAGDPNHHITIENNEIFNFMIWSGGFTRAYGINITATGNGSNWKIAGNSIYNSGINGQNQQTAINFIPGSSSTNDTISGNWIGGSSAQCGTGGGVTYWGNSWDNYSSGENRVIGMYVNCGTIAVTGNNINNIWVSNGDYSGFVGMNFVGSTVPTVTNNVFGYGSNGQPDNSRMIRVSGGGVSGSYYPGYIYGIWNQSTTSSMTTYDSNDFYYLWQSGSWTGGAVQCIMHLTAGPATITNNRINGAQAAGLGSVNSFGIRVEPTTSTSGNVIDGNKIAGPYITVTDAYAYGTNNFGIRVLVPGTSTVSGTIRKNVIWDMRNADYGGFGVTEAIYVYTTTGGNGNWDISNNMITLKNNNSTTNCVGLYGIDVALNSSSTTTVQYNTVYIGGSNGGAGLVGADFSSYAYFRMPNSSGTVTGDAVTLNNNILINSRLVSSSAVTGHFAIGNYGTSNYANNWNTSNYNFLFTNNGSKSYIGIWGTTKTDAAGGTIAGWKSASGKDANSYTATVTTGASNFGSGLLNPDVDGKLFSNTLSDLHISNSDGQSYHFVNNRGTPISITTDYDGQTRNNTNPDLGADEFSTANDAGVIAVKPNCNGTSVDVTIKNFGSATLTSFKVDWSVNGTGQPQQTYTSQSVASGATVVKTISLTTPSSFTAATAYNVVAYTTLPNGVADENSANDSYTANPLYYGMGATVYVGSSGSPLFSTYSALFNAINNSVLTANLSVIVNNSTSEPSSPIFLNAVGYCGGTRTITITPASATIFTATGPSGTSDNQGMIGFNGAANVTIDGNYSGSGQYLRFRNTNSSYPTFHFRNDANVITVKNALIEGNNNTTYVSGGITNAPGIIFFGDAAVSGSGNRNISFTGNTIRDRSDATGVPANAIFSYNTTSGVYNKNISIKNNNIFNFSQTGVYLPDNAGNGTAWNISGNSFYCTSDMSSYQSVVPQHIAIYLKSSVSHTDTIKNNFIGGSAAGATGTWTNSNSSIDFEGIRLEIGGTGSQITLVDSNTIRKITLSGTGLTMFMGIRVKTGLVDITNNVIGDTAATLSSPSILVAGSGTPNYTNDNVQIFGIWNYSTSASTISNNIVAGIRSTAPYMTESGHAYLTGIRRGAREYGTNSLNVYAGKSIIRGNTIANLFSESSLSNVNMNGKYQDRVWPAALSGIALRSNYGSDNRVDSNTVYNLFANATWNRWVRVNGIALNAETSADAGIVSKNRVYDLNNHNGGVFGAEVYTPSISGITIGGADLVGITSYVANGSYTLVNNMIHLAPEVHPTKAYNNPDIYGILDVTRSGNTTKYYFNTVYITGSGKSSLPGDCPVVPSYGFMRSAAGNGETNGGTVYFKNNIVINNRSGYVDHFTICNNTSDPATGWSGSNVDYNFLSTGNTNTVAQKIVGNFQTGPATSYTFSGWKSAFSCDANSKYAQTVTGSTPSSYTNDPSVDVVNPGAGYLFVDPDDIVADDKFLHIDMTDGNSNLFVKENGTVVTGIDIDFDNDDRDDTKPTIGADELMSCPSPVVNLQPADKTVCPGNTEFVVTATSPSTLRYQWQLSTDGGSSWSDLSNGGIYSSVDNDTLHLTGLTNAQNSYKYRVKVMNDCDTIPSNAATLTVTAPPSITAHNPVSFSNTICEGSNTYFAITATGAGTLSYRWEVSSDGGTSWSSVSNGGAYSGASNDTLSFSNTPANLNGNKYRAIVSSSVCSVEDTSNTGNLTVMYVNITTQPVASIDVCAGQPAIFFIAATASNPPISYQWQVSTNGGGTWSNISNGGTYSGVDNDTLTLLSPTVGMQGYKYRVQASANCTSVSNVGTISNVYQAPSITYYEAGDGNNDIIYCSGTMVLKGKVTGSSPTNKWQVSNDGGATWSDISGGAPYTINSNVDTSMLSINLTGSYSSYWKNKYRLIGSNSCGNDTSDVATLYRQTTPSITTQPKQRDTICAGSSTSKTFSYDVLSVDTNYLWQFYNGGSWVNVSNGTPTGFSYTGINANDLQISTTGSAPQGTYRFRNKLITGCGSIYTDSAMVMVRPSDVAYASMEITPSLIICNSTPASFTAVPVNGGSTPGYQWQLDAGSGWGNVSGATNNIYTDISVSNGNKYRVIMTSSLPGCVTGSPDTSSAVTMTVLNGSPGVWIGGHDTNWSDYRNWCDGVPDSTTNVVIPDVSNDSGNFPVISDSAFAHNLSIEDGASVTINVSQGNLSLYGDLDIANTATYNHTDGIIRFTGSSAQTTDAISAYDVVMNNSSGVTLNGNLTVTNTLTLMKGVMTTGTKSVIVTDTAVGSIIAAGANDTSYTVSYINGNLTRYFADSSNSTYHFPVGNATYGRLASVKFNHLSGKSGTNPYGIRKFTAFFKNGPVNTGGFQTDQYLNAWETSIPGNPYHTAYKRMRDEGTWIVEPDSVAAKGTYDINLFFNGFITPALPDNQFGILKRDTGSTTFADWKPAGGTLSAVSGPGRLKNNGYALRKGLSSFSEFGIGETDNLLPIQLTTFTAEKCNNDLDALLKWNTASELNNDHFDVELALDNHSNGELTFSKIGEVKGAGTSTVENNYQFIDKQMNKSGNRYYRLRQVDFNGSDAYSEIRVLNFSTTKLEVSALYPNPTGDNLNFVITTPYDKSVTISVTNILGQEVFLGTENLSEGVTTLHFDVSTLAQGVYFLNVKDGRDVNIHRKFEKF